MATSALPRSLADDLRSRSAGQIMRLLHFRPDLLQPWPGDLGQLARRAADDASVLEAMQSLTTLEVRVLEVLASVHEAGISDIAAALPTDPGIEDTVASLWSRALLWGGSDTYRIVRAAQQAFGPYPCGLAGPSHTPPDPAMVREAAAQTPPEQLQEWIWRNPVSDQSHPLLDQRGEKWVLPREASLLLREGCYLLPADPPDVADRTEPAPGHSLWNPLAGVRYLLTDLSRSPLVMHSTRGVSRRVVTDRADAMSVAPEDLLVWLELAAVAGLIGPDDAVCRPTVTAHGWLHAEPSEMWAALIAAWLRSERPLGASVPEALGCLTSTVHPRTAVHREHILAVWPQASGLDTEQTREVVSWWRPRMHEATDQVPEVHRELVALGLLEAGVPTAAMTALPFDLAQAAEHLPPAQAHGLIVQPDSTVIAPLSVDGRTWELLQAIAHVESWGPVTVHRIDPGRLRGAVAGRDPQELLAALEAASKTPIPQSIEYAVRDASRASGARVYPATVIEATPEDTALLRELGLTQVSPQVFTSDQSPETVRRWLESAGIATTQGPDPAFGATMERAGPGPAPDGAAVARLVEHLLSGQPAHSGTPPQMSEAAPETIADVCRTAIAEDRRLWVRFAEGDRVRTELVEPIDLRVGRLSGWSLNEARMITVPLSRIAALGSADD